jgi:hypothetical protein
VVILVCVLIGAFMALGGSDLYRAEVLVRIGKGQTTNIPTLLDEPQNLVTTLPIEYSGVIGNDCALLVGMISGTPLIRISVQGPERKKVKESLEKVTGLFVEAHRKRSEEIIESYRVLTRGIGKYIEANGEQMAQFGVSSKEVSGVNKKNSIDFRTDSDLWSERDSLIDLKRKSECKIFINSLRTNMTQTVGRIGDAVPVKPSILKYLIFAGMFGIAISIGMSFLIEYVQNAKKERKMLA